MTTATSMYTYIDEFEKKSGNGVFPNIDRKQLVADLKARMAKPSLVDQSYASLCGPACMAYIVLSKLPAAWAAYVMSLYDTGSAKLGRGMLVKPSEGCRNAKPGGKISGVDWVGLASLRDSENAVWEYNNPDDAFAGITMPGGLENWFKQMKWTGVKEETNLVRTKDADNLRDASRLFAQGHSICLFVWGDVVNGHKAGFFTTPNHWVVLTRMPQITKQSVTLQVYTWGGLHNLNLSPEIFFAGYYGYVAGKWS